MTQVSILHALRRPTYLLIFLGSAFLFFDLNYYLMATLPGTKDNMCVMGANFTPLNITFSIIFSILLGIMVVGILLLFQKQKTRKNVVASSSLSGVGAVIGFFTVFCTICSLPVFSLFGISLGLGFFVEYNLFIKFLSLVFLTGGLWILHQQLKENCQVCMIQK